MTPDEIADLIARTTCLYEDNITWDDDVYESTTAAIPRDSFVLSLAAWYEYHSEPGFNRDDFIKRAGVTTTYLPYVVGMGNHP